MEGAILQQVDEHQVSRFVVVQMVDDAGEASGCTTPVQQTHLSQQLHREAEVELELSVEGGAAIAVARVLDERVAQQRKSTLGHLRAVLFTFFLGLIVDGDECQQSQHEADREGHTASQAAQARRQQSTNLSRGQSEEDHLTRPIEATPPRSTAHLSELQRRQIMAVDAEHDGLAWHVDAKQLADNDTDRTD